MIEHIWSVLCSRSVIDSETNNVSIQDVIEHIIINAEPTENGLALSSMLNQRKTVFYLFRLN